MSNNIVIMEDVKHYTMWNYTINALRQMYDFKIKPNVTLKIDYDYTNDTDIKLDIKSSDNIYSIKERIVTEIFKDKPIKEIFKNEVVKEYYLCKYSLNDNGDIACCKCPAKMIFKIDKPVKCTENNLCACNIHFVIYYFKIHDILSLQNDEFEGLIYMCNKLRDIEYKDNVILRRTLEKNKQIIN